MKISRNWLESYIECSRPSRELAGLLTQCGLEVASIYDRIPGHLDGLIIGQVISCGKHPHADRLQQVLVDVGHGQQSSIICGAPNVKVGQKVVVAPVGTTIYRYKTGEPFLIKRAKIRGLVSEGMLCAEDEIGVGADHEGIIVLNTTLSPGTPAKQYFAPWLDEILEIEITPNRVDACSHLGIARELRALLHQPITWPNTSYQVTRTSDLAVDIKSVNTHLCPRYCGVVIEGVVVDHSPEWIKRRLEGIGVKSINNIVDITNFVLHELGQPLHAFDYDAIAGSLLMVKKVMPGTLFKSLDGVDRQLTGQEIMVCDQDGPIAMAGIICGLRTSIQPSTRRIFIESGYFNPEFIRTAAKEHGIQTDASFRFERGADPNMTLFALHRAICMLQSLMPDIAISACVDLYPNPIPDVDIPVLYEHIDQLLGIDIDPCLVKQILQDLDITVTKESDRGFVAQVPPYRTDVLREVDIIEEVARIYGYNRIPAVPLAHGCFSADSHVDRVHKFEQIVSGILSAQGFYEICSSSFANVEYADRFGQDGDQAKRIDLLNPLSHCASALRQSLLFGGLENISRNIARKHYNIKFFEFGRVYSKVGKQYVECQKLALWITGQQEKTNWIRQLGDVSLESLRAVIDQLLNRSGITFPTYKEITHGFYKQAVDVQCQGISVAVFGQIKPEILEYFSIDQPVFGGELYWDKLGLMGDFSVHCKPVSKFPFVQRDLSLWIDQKVTYQDIVDSILMENNPYIKDFYIVDVYHHKELDNHKKSYAIRFILQDLTQTLKEEDIDKIMQQLISVFESKFNAIIRR